MRRVFFCASLLLAPALAAQELTQPHKPVEITIAGSPGFGFADGFLQTPAGGEPGTSSVRRPTFHELNIEDVAFYDGRLKLQWHQLGLFGGYQFIRFDESGVLPRTFVTRGVSLAVDDLVRTKDKFD